MKRRADAALFWVLKKWVALYGVPVLGRVLAVLTSNTASQLMAGHLRREAARLDAHAESVVGLDDELARVLRLHAADYREQARGLS